MEFEEFLKSKKIDPAKFKKGDEKLFLELKTLFDQVHPNSFVQQKLFLINKTRRTYLLQEAAEEKPAAKPKMAKPKIVPKKPKLS